MVGITFDDLVPQASPSAPTSLAFDDLLPKTPKQGPMAAPFMMEGPDGKLTNVFEGLTQDEANAKLDEMHRRQAEEEQRRLDSRSYRQRASDAIAFGMQLPGRLLSGGKYGTSEALETIGAPGMAEVLRQGEQSFAGANQDALEKVAAAGEVAAAIPELGSLGATGRELAAMGKIAARGEASAGSVARTAGRAQAAVNAGERLKDIEAFREVGVEPFGPALASKGIARLNRNIEEYPIVSSVVKEPRLGVEAKLADEQSRIASELGAPPSDEGAGLIAQRGLDRYRTAKLPDLEPSIPEGLGIPASNPSSKGRPGEVRVGDATPQKVSKFSTSEMTPEQIRAGEASGKGSGIEFNQGVRRTVADLSDGELERLLPKKSVGTPSHNTSFATVQEALYEKAHRKLPALFRKDGSRNPNEIATPETAGVVSGLLKQEKSARISGGILEGRFGDMVSDILNGKSNFTVETLRAARTEIGRALNNFGMYDARLDRSQLKQIYAGLSRDIERGLVAIAARARRDSRLPEGSPSRVSKEVAGQADQALYHMRVADRYTRASMARMERFMNVLGANTLDEAGRKIGRYVREKTSDMGALRAMKSALRPEEWNSIAGYVVANLGKGRPGAKEAESAFNVSHVATDLAKLDPAAKDLLFGRDTPVRQSIERLGRLSERMKYYESTRNTSGTAYSSMLGGLGLGTLVHPASLAALVGTLGSTAATGKFFTSQKYVNWLEKAYQKEAAGASRSQMEAHLRSLAEMASKDPDIGHDILKAIAGLNEGSQDRPVAFIPLPKSSTGAPSAPTGVTPELPTFKTDAEVRRALASGALKRGDRFRLGDAVKVAP